MFNLLKSKAPVITLVVDGKALYEGHVLRFRDVQAAIAQVTQLRQLPGINVAVAAPEGKGVQGVRNARASLKVARTVGVI